MAKARTTEYWEIDPLDGQPSAAWMLVDRHRDWRVIAADGAAVHAPGSCLHELLAQTEGLSDWLDAQFCDPNAEVLLLPLAGEAWFVFTHFYLSAGYLLLTRLPSSDGDSLALARSGRLGAISVFGGMSTSLPQERDFDACDALAWWDAVNACLPRPLSTASEPDEIDSAVRAVANLGGIRIYETAKYGVVPGCAGIAPAATDLNMLSVMLLLSFRALSACGVSRISLGYEGMEEGYAVHLIASGLTETAHTEGSLAMSACRELAQRNGQIFTCTVQEHTLDMTLCAVRKDYALLGVKIPPICYE